MSEHPTTNENTVLILSCDPQTGCYGRDCSFINSEVQGGLQTTKALFTLISVEGTKKCYGQNLPSAYVSVPLIFPVKTLKCM